MPVDTQQIMRFLERIAADERLETTVSHALKNGLIIGGAATVAGILFGPFGLAIAGTLASCSTAIASGNKMTSVVEIISSMNSEQQEALADDVRDIMRSVNATDVVVLAGMMASNSTVKQQVISSLINYLTQEMGMAVSNR